MKNCKAQLPHWLRRFGESCGEERENREKDRLARSLLAGRERERDMAELQTRRRLFRIAKDGLLTTDSSLLLA